jgi:hypothetical protein
MMLLMGLASDSFPMADINGSLAVAPSAPASLPVKPWVADMAPMLFLSHSDHASNGAKAAELAFGEPVSPLLPLESVINRSFPSTERLVCCTLYKPVLAFYREPI